jgi:hypothetical protein
MVLTALPAQTGIGVTKTASFDGRVVSGTIRITNEGENQALISRIEDHLEVHFPKSADPPQLPEGSTRNWFEVAEVTVANPVFVEVGEAVDIDYSFDLCRARAEDFTGANSMRNVVAVTLANKPEGTKKDTVVTRSEGFEPPSALDCPDVTIGYSENFEQGVGYSSGTSQWDNWVAFRAMLDTSAIAFNSITFSGSNDPIGFTCSDPAIVDQIADALRLNGSFGGVCDGHAWSVAPCGLGPALGVDNPACSSCSDMNVLRPQIGGSEWGGLGTPNSCFAPTQTLELELIGTP